MSDAHNPFPSESIGTSTAIAEIGLSESEEAYRKALGPFAERAPTNAERGAFLIAVGEQMLKHDLMAGAALDGDSNEEIIASMQKNGIDGEIARAMLYLDTGYFTEAVDGDL